MGKKWISKKEILFISIFFEMKQKKINFKHFAILNAYLLKRFFQNNFQIKLKLNGLMIYFAKKENLWNFTRRLITKKKNFLIVGIGINTNLDPKNKGFSSTSLKKIMNKNIDNNKLLNNIKKIYEKFLTKDKTYHI